MKTLYVISSWLVSFVLFFCMATSVQGQATIRGKVSDGETGEVLLGATVRLMQDGTLKGGAYTDIEGSYTIKAAPGDYQLLVSYVSFITDTLEVTAVANEVTVNEVLLFQDQQVREDLTVEITAKVNRASDVAFLGQKKNSINTIDGVTLDLVQRTGDPNVAAAVRRVVGVTVEGGKYVYVRGLGDRYSKTLLNGAELPGLDPNRNTVQMDLFPSNLIDQIVVYKNFTPDLPGSFSGGLIDVRTKDFPDRFTLNASASLGFNDQASLEDNFLADEKLDGDGLGFSNEARDLPTFIAQDLNGVIPAYPTTLPQLEQNGPILAQATRSFQTGFLPVQRQSGLNQNYEISIGNQHLIGNRPFGYIASFSFRRNFNYFQDGIRNQFALQGVSATSLETQVELTGDRGQEEVLWGGLVKVSYKPFDNHKFSVNYMHNQSGTSYGESFAGRFFSSGGDISLETRTTGYIERTIDVGQLQGEHAFGPLKADWIVSLSTSRQYEPDLRFFANEVLAGTGGNPNSFLINNGNGYDNPLRFYRDLEEDNLDVRLNLELPLLGIGTTERGKIRFGGAYTQKLRDFGENRYELARGRDAEQFNGSVADYTAEDNLFDIPVDENGNIVRSEWFQGLYYLTRTLQSNLFEATQDIFAGYAMVELPMGPKLRLVAGARYEGTEMQIIPDDSTLFDPIIQEDPEATPGVLSLNDLLPAANVIYKLTDKINLRGGYARTLARPSIFEFSQFERLPYIGGPIYLGNPLLERTLIDNFDLRWEWFYSIQELISVSAFYKNFENPIELAQDFRTQNLRFQYVNRDRAFIYGVELEFKKNFGFISDALSRLQLTTNASFVYSETELTEQEKENILAVDPERETTRPLFGQSPYVVNAELAYIDKEEADLQVSLSLNVFGPRLFAVGGVAPDIYEQPRPALNFSISKGIGKYLSVRFRANNLLNPEYNFVQEFQGQEFTFQNNRVGRRFSLGLGFRL